MSNKTKAKKSLKKEEEVDESKKYVDKITLEYLSGNRYSKLDDAEKNQIKNIKARDLIFYKKRIINTTRELIRAKTDPSFNETNNIIENIAVQEVFTLYAHTLIQCYQQDDLNDLIQDHNGFIDDNNNNDNNIDNNNYDLSLNENENQLTIDREIFMNINANVKNRYDWSRFCKIEKKPHDPAVENMKRRNTPKLGEYNLKDPALRTKGIKSREN